MVVEVKDPRPPVDPRVKNFFGFFPVLFPVDLFAPTDNFLNRGIVQTVVARALVVITANWQFLKIANTRESRCKTQRSAHHQAHLPVHPVASGKEAKKARKRR